MRGQPVLVLLLLLGCWTGVRGVLWETPFVRIVPQSVKIGRSAVEELVLLESSGHSVPYQLAAPLLSTLVPGASARRARTTASIPPGAPPSPAPTDVYEAFALTGAADAQPASPSNPFAVPLAAPYQPLPGWGEPLGVSRWSADAWVLVRRDTATAVTSGRGSYGNSQAGGVLRYRLVPSSYYRPMAYLRVSKALAGAREKEAALGLSARPLPPVPLRAAVELRVTRTGDQTITRPAAYAVTELPPLALPFGFTGEAYGQGGYVGGKYATAFVDGQVRVERTFVAIGDSRFTAGGGMWGGAQEGASRLDAGPSASVGVGVGKVSSRVSLDWRFRVAGHANPASGPTLTISAGF